MRTLQLRELESSFGLLNSTSSRSQCVLPLSALPLWTDALRRLFTAPEPLSCSTLEQNWVYVNNSESRLHVSDSAVQRHGVVSCNYTPVHRGRDDFDVRMLYTIPM